jgi:hypothetical protein
VDRERRLKHGKIETETVWLITSLSPEEASAERLLELARAYWGIENDTQRPLDTVSDEDRCRVCQPVAATGLGLFRRLRQLCGAPHNLIYVELVVMLS